MAYHPSSELPGGPYVRPPAQANGFFITLHLFLPNGQFVCEHSVCIGMGIDAFTQLLEAGLVTPELNLTHHDRPKVIHAGIELLHDDYVYELVFNGVVLEDGDAFCDYVLAHGMSLDEPNDIYVVAKERVHTDPLTGR